MATSTSRVLVSLFLISIILLPVVYVVGILLPTFIYQASQSFVSEYSDFFTVLGICLLLMVIVPPWDKKKIGFLSRAIKRLWRNFVKPKPSDDVVFKDDILHFGTGDTPSNESVIKEGVIQDVLLLDEAHELYYPANYTRDRNLYLKQKTKKRNITQILMNYLFSSINRLKKVKELYFFERAKLFLYAFFVKISVEYHSTRGEECLTNKNLDSNKKMESVI